MSDPRLLSAEHFAPNSHLNVWRRLQAESFQARQIAESELKGHIAALTEQLATLRTEAAKLGHESGCDADKYRMGDEAAGEDDFVPINGPCSCAQSRIQGVKHERE